MDRTGRLGRERSLHWCDLASDCGECRRTCNRRYRGLQGQDGPSIGGRGRIIDADSFACGAILGHCWLGAWLSSSASAVPA